MSRKDKADAGVDQRSVPKHELTDKQWSLIAELFPVPQPSPKGGRPARDARECFDGICWFLRSGARWKDMPDRFPSGSTCWRRFGEWCASGAMTKAWSRLLGKLQRAGKVQTEESFADGTFASAKKGVLA